MVGEWLWSTFVGISRLTSTGASLWAHLSETSSLIRTGWTPGVQLVKVVSKSMHGRSAALRNANRNMPAVIYWFLLPLFCVPSYSALQSWVLFISFFSFGTHLLLRYGWESFIGSAFAVLVLSWWFCSIFWAATWNMKKKTLQNILPDLLWQLFHSSNSGHSFCPSTFCSLQSSFFQLLTCLSPAPGNLPFLHHLPKHNL